MNLFRRTSITLGIPCLISVGAWAQQNSGSMSGTVTDPTAGAIPAATVTATSIGTGLKTTTVTTDHSFASFLAGLIVFNLFAVDMVHAPSVLLHNSIYVKRTVFPLEILPCPGSRS